MQRLVLLLFSHRRGTTGPPNSVQLKVALPPTVLTTLKSHQINFVALENCPPPRIALRDLVAVDVVGVVVCGGRRET